MVVDEWDLVCRLSLEERTRKEFELECVSPDDSKYVDTGRILQPLLSQSAEWRECARFQRILLETRVEFGQAEQRHLEEVDAALPKLSFLNMALLEKDKRINHDQLAVIEEFGRHVSTETKALLHPGTTSFDILDSVRSYLFRRAWKEVIRPAVTDAICKLADLADRFTTAYEEKQRFLQTGRTHLQNTSPVPFGLTLSAYARRFVDRVKKCDGYFGDLKGKVSGIVGTGAGIEMVVGDGRGLEFERAVLRKLGLEPDTTATQIVQKENLSDVGHGLVTLVTVLKDFANDMRLLYSSAIREVVSADNTGRLGGSSTDAAKDNPINWENIAGKATVVESGMRILYELIHSDLQRDLMSSVQARYQPQPMMVEVHEMFTRFGKSLTQLQVVEDRMKANLEAVKRFPSEAMVTILRGEGWVHPTYGPGHDFVKHMSRKAVKENRSLIEVALEDRHFATLYGQLPEKKRAILYGKLEHYAGFSISRARGNIAHTKVALTQGPGF